MAASAKGVKLDAILLFLSNVRRVTELTMIGLAPMALN
jgi:hypothetical protein